jgi:hypothetical protein
MQHPRSYANTSLKLSKVASVSSPSPQYDFPADFSIDYRFGWFWECPSGGEKCQYKHALPPGFVLKSQKKAEAEAARANVISLEEFLEVEVCVLTCANRIRAVLTPFH